MRTQFDRKKIDKYEHSSKNIALKLYELVLQSANNESQIVWNFSNSFAIANSVVVAFVLSKLDPKYIFEKNTILFAVSLLGMFINFLWLSAFCRKWEWYRFRMFQVRQREPENWSLNAGDGKNFSDGKSIEDTIENKNEERRIPLLGRIFRTDLVIYLLILSFMLIYLFIAIITKPF